MFMKPFGLVSDQHFHLWSAFATTLPNGLNSRLSASLGELRRCANEVKKLGGSLIVNAGDTFHQRGNLSPEVLNPVMDLHRELIEEGFTIITLAGNHDLAGKTSTRLGSAITALEGLGVQVVNDVRIFEKLNLILIPWMPNIHELKKQIESIDMDDRGIFDLVIHAPIDGVIAGLPDHGLTAEWLAKQGFYRVFSGHYHNKKDFGNNVWSIGSTGHLTWSDVGSKAGFLTVTNETVKWWQSHTPEFIDLDSGMDPDEVPMLVDGNYVRAKVTTSKANEIKELREWLMKCGAKGVIINTVKEPTKVRTGAIATAINSGASIEASIASFIASSSFTNAAQVQIECQKLLAEMEV